MVSFICNACGQTVKKNRVEKHYQTECPSCSVLSCIDCGKDFHGDAYAEHTSCISEAEKYQGKLYQPKEKANKGEAKQQEWIKKVQETGDGIRNPKLKGYLNRIQEYSNVPRKKAKFINFCRNSLKLHDSCTLEQLWEVFDPKKESQENGEGRKKDDSVISNGHSTMNIEKDEEISNVEIKETWKREKNDIKKSKKQRTEGDSVISNGHSSISTENDEGASNIDINKNPSGEKGNIKRAKKRKMKNKSIEEEMNNKEDSNENLKCKKKRKKINEAKNDDGESDSKLTTNEVLEKFSWQKRIKSLLKEAGENGVPLKKLQKKVIAQYCAHGSSHEATTKDECIALFKRKLAGYRKAKLLKERVFYSKN